MTANAAVSAIARMISSDGKRVICGTSAAVLATENAYKSFNNWGEAVSSSAPYLSHVPFPTVPYRFTENLHFTHVTHPGLPDESSMAAAQRSDRDAHLKRNSVRKRRLAANLCCDNSASRPAHLL